MKTQRKLSIDKIDFKGRIVTGYYSASNSSMTEGNIDYFDGSFKIQDNKKLYESDKPEGSTFTRLSGENNDIKMMQFYYTDYTSYVEQVTNNIRPIFPDFKIMTEAEFNNAPFKKWDFLRNDNTESYEYSYEEAINKDVYPGGFYVEEGTFESFKTEETEEPNEGI